MPTRRFLLAHAALAGFGIPALAQPAGPFPGERPIRLVVPFPAGGTSDLRARQVAERMRLNAGWNIVVENRAGASGMMGADVVAKAPADGHALLLGTVGLLAINPHLFPGQPYDVARDLQGVTQFSRSVTVLAAHRDTGIRSLEDLVRRARSGPPLAYASTGNGTIGHMVGETFRKAAALDLAHVPYKGTAPAVQDFVAHHVPLLYETPSAIWEHLRSGRAIALALTGAERMQQLPACPTFREAGYPEVVFDTWQGLLTRRGVPAPVLEALHREAVRALRDPEIVRSHEAQVNIVVANTPVEFDRFIQAESVKWRRVVAQTGAQPT